MIDEIGDIVEILLKLANFCAEKRISEDAIYDQNRTIEYFCLI